MPDQAALRFAVEAPMSRSTAFAAIVEEIERRAFVAGFTAMAQSVFDASPASLPMSLGQWPGTYDLASLVLHEGGTAFAAWSS